MSAAEVRREDQVLINEFGRLNAHARELREERALLQKRLEEVDDATTELAMGDGDDVCIPRRAAAPATRRRARAGPAHARRRGVRRRLRGRRDGALRGGTGGRPGRARRARRARRRHGGASEGAQGRALRALRVPDQPGGVNF